MSVAYVFVHVMPDLGEGQDAVRKWIGAAVRFVEHHVYLIALLGRMVLRKGLAKTARPDARTH